jgi:hypothetical protein
MTAKNNIRLVWLSQDVPQDRIPEESHKWGFQKFNERVSWGSAVYVADLETKEIISNYLAQNWDSSG